MSINMEFRNTITILNTHAKLHDVGKICIPDHIIQKLGKLTSDELDEVKTHSSIAAEYYKKACTRQ